MFDFLRQLALWENCNYLWNEWLIDRPAAGGPIDACFRADFWHWLSIYRFNANLMTWIFAYAITWNKQLATLRLAPEKLFWQERQAHVPSIDCSIKNSGQCKVGNSPQRSPRACRTALAGIRTHVTCRLLQLPARIHFQIIIYDFLISPALNHKSLAIEV